MNALRVLLIDELRDLLDAEKQLTRALPKLARAATAPSLASAFTAHLQQTQKHVQRLEQALRLLKAPVRGKPCPGMKGLISEGQEMVSELPEEPVRDAALIVSAQKVEHYEIAAYGSCKAFASLLGESKVVGLLEQTLAEEKATDAKLSALAEGQVNKRADASDTEPTSDREGIFAQATQWIQSAVASGADALKSDRTPRRRRSAKRTSPARRTHEAPASARRQPPRRTTKARKK